MKQRCTQNSESLLRTPVDKKKKKKIKNKKKTKEKKQKTKNESRKIAGSTEGAVSVDRCGEDWVVPLS